MGQAIITAAPAAGAVIAAACDQGDNPADHLAACDVVIDFSFQAATAPLAVLCANAGKPLVIGTTGHSDADRATIRAQAEKIPIVWAGNYSVGVNLLNALTRLAASVLGDSYDPEVVELHHRLKKDSPSGTAERLVDVIREVRGLTREQEKHGRQGLVGERPTAEIGIHAVRGGDIVGEHTVYFCGLGERIELTHRATDRRIFAQGALRAAVWVVGKNPQVYGMEEVLGLDQLGKTS
jgi:4-hydroxy-tetrahydrodipicolinate reductase